MKKEGWEKLHEILSKIYSNFRTDYYNMRNGKNKKIRDRALYDVENEINLAASWIEKYPDSFDLMTGANANGFDKQIVWDEFILPNWFNVDMPDFLKRIKIKIETYE